MISHYSWRQLYVKMLIVFSFVGCVIICGYYSITSDDNPTTVGESSNDRVSSLNLKNITLNNKINLANAPVSGSYSVYSIEKNIITLGEMNKTILKIFDVTINNSINISNASNKYIFSINNSTSIIFSNNGLIEWYLLRNDEKYLNDEITNDSKLYNISEANKIVDTYLSHLINEYNLSIYLRDIRKTSIVSEGKNYTESYTFIYYRTINNVSCVDKNIGYIKITITPNGTITRFIYYYPALKKIHSVISPNITETVRHVDNEFMSAKKQLYSGFSSYELYDYKRAYGYINGEIVIGWELFFYCGGNTDIIDSIFQSG